MAPVGKFPQKTERKGHRGNRMRRIKYLFPRSDLSMDPPARPVGEMTAIASVCRDHAQARVGEPQRKFPVFIDGDVFGESPPASRKAARGTDWLEPEAAAHNRLHCGWLRSASISQIKKPARPRARINSGLRSLVDRSEIAFHVLDRHAHARQLGFRHGRDPRFFSRTRRPVSGLAKNWVQRS